MNEHFDSVQQEWMGQADLSATVAKQAAEERALLFRKVEETVGRREA